MDVGLWAGVAGAVAGVIGVPVAWYYGHRAAAPGRPQVKVDAIRFSKNTRDEDGKMRGEPFISVKVHNLGDRPVTITKCALRPSQSRNDYNDVHLVIEKNPETPLPYCLDPGSLPARFSLRPVSDLDRLGDRAYTRLRVYVMLADNTMIYSGAIRPGFRM